MGAGTLQRTCPDDVRALVEAGLDLDHDDDLLAALCRVDERSDDRRIAARAIQRHLDGQHVRIDGRLLDEALDRPDERLVGVVDEHVALAHGGEDVDVLVVVLGLEAGWRDRRPRRRLEVGDVEVGDRLEAAQVEHAPDLVEVGRIEAEALEQERTRVVRHRPLDLEADDVAEAPATQLLLDRHQEVVGLVLLDREVGVARDAEQVVGEHLHAREQHVEVRGDDPFEQHVRPRRDLPTSAAAPAAP